MRTNFISIGNSLYRWEKLTFTVLLGLMLIIYTSCQKDTGNLLQQEALNGTVSLSVSDLSLNPTVFYGPQTFTRNSGSPVTVIQTLGNTENWSSTFMLKIQNGNGKATRVSSGEISINGNPITGPSDFSKNVTLITKQINGLASGSTLEVKLSSAPGSFISLWIEGTLKQLPPDLTTTSVICFTSTAAAIGGNITSDEGSAVTARGVCWSTSTSPTTADSKTSDGTGTGIFTSEILGLAGGTTYYARAYATNSGGTAYGNEVTFKTASASFPNCGTVTDYDGNVYNTVTIGTQCWMKENLKSTHFADGTPIPDGTGKISEGDLFVQYYFNYDDDPANGDFYGRFYTWAAAMKGAEFSNSIPSGIQGACPTGWHLPSDAEWEILSNELGGGSIAGGKMKEACTFHWAAPNTGADNSSNFTALGAGYCGGHLTYSGLGQNATFWSSTGYVDKANCRFLDNNHSSLQNYIYAKPTAISIRCVKD